MKRQDIQIQVDVTQNGKCHSFQVDTGARTNFMSLQRWKMIGKPSLQQTTAEYRSASGHAIPILGTVRVDSSLQTGEETLAPKELEFTATKLNLNLIGLDTVWRAASIWTVFFINSQRTHRCAQSPGQITSPSRKRVNSSHGDSPTSEGMNWDAYRISNWK